MDHRRTEKTGLFLVLLLGAALTLPAGAQTPEINPALLDGVWPATWISHPTASRTAFGVFHFRRTFELAEPPESFVIHVSADNRYRLFVNGAPVASGPARGDLMHWRFETLDVAPYLHAGQNTLAAVVWNFAEHRPVAQISHETAFLVQSNTEREAVVNTDARWKVIQDDAYAPVPVDREALGWVYIVVGPGEQVDAGRYPWGWETTAFDDAAWPAALELRAATQHWGPNYGGYAGWKLTPRILPMMEETPQRIPRIARAEGLAAHDGFLKGTEALVVPPHTTASILLDQTRLTTAYPALLVDGGAGSRITLTYAEALFDEDGQKGNRNEIAGKQIRGYHDVFLPDGGARRAWRSLWWRTWRYLQLDVVTGAEPLTLRDVYGVFTAYPFEERAAFSSSDTTLANVWDAGWRTARLCAAETYFDCPYYEQLQYAGDTRIQALISLYVAGDDRLMRKAIRAFDDSRLPAGLTQSRYPSSEAQYIPPYSLFWIAMVYDYWMHRDDPDFVRGLLTGVRGVIDWYEARLDETGMLGPTPWWNFVDWSFPRGVPPGADEGHSSIIALQLIYVLGYAAEMAAAFDRPDEAAHYRRLAASLKDATYRQCWDEARGLLADTPDKQSFSQHANVMAVLVDLVPEDQQPALMQRVDDDETLVPCTYYYRFYLDRAMKKAGLAERYVERLQPWREMLALGLTTFAEKEEPTRSDAHAWSASPNYHLLETVCGIEPAAPGFASVRIAPALGALTWVEGRMPHPLGEIRVALRRKGVEGVEGEITLPPGLTGTFVWKGREVPLRSGAQTIDF